MSNHAGHASEAVKLSLRRFAARPLKNLRNTPAETRLQQPYGMTDDRS
jgi:hypothetical protein